MMFEWIIEEWLSIYQNNKKEALFKEGSTYKQKVI